MELRNRSAIITGSNRGFGKAVAQAFINAGANVLLCARDSVLLEKVRIELTQLAQNGQRILSQPCDVSDAADVDRLFETALAHLGSVQVLVNNAGVYGPMGPIESVDWEEWKQAFEINLYGPVLTMRAALSHFREQGYGKIINLSGGGATNPLPHITGYAASKAALVRLTETVAEEVRDAHIDVNAVAPGALDTRLLNEVLEAGPETVGETFYQKMVAVKKQGGTPLEKGAALCVFLASAASDGITGKLISAVWDPWDKLREHLQELQSTDTYTLRRIVPEDRGMKWE